MCEYTFEDLLTPLGRRRASDLAMLCAQAKIEKELVAEIMFRGNRAFPHLDFCVEEKPRRDLTIRERSRDGTGRLVEWVEAKMCYSDCLARAAMGGYSKSKAYEYAHALREDAKRQRGVNLAVRDRRAARTTMLFAAHLRDAVPRQKYYPGFRNRARANFSSRQVEEAAREFARKEIPQAARRELVEEFDVKLDANTLILVFVYRK